MIEVHVQSAVQEARDVKRYELATVDGSLLPPSSAGAHVDLHLPDGGIRAYSLVNRPGDRERYAIAVQRQPAGRGGSRFLHDNLKVGDRLVIGAPRNNFPLAELAPHHVLVAGGIGITPLWSMVQRLDAIGGSWKLHYAARSRDRAAFLAPLRRWVGTGRVRLKFDDESSALLDLHAIVAEAPAAAHFYCCGPAPMLEAFRAASARLAAERVHLERFSLAFPADVDRAFRVVLARSGRELEVAPTQSILDALLDAGLEVEHSCEEGFCGACETAVVEGLPEHRDVVLSDEAKSANRSMMICCSRSLTETLVLDL